MTHVRRRLLFALLVLLLTVPAESVLLRVLAATSDSQAASQWASSLSSSGLQAAAAQIEAYPFLYRRAIMTALTSQDRATVWQHHLQKYLDAHSELSAEAVGLLWAAIPLITPDAVSGAGDNGDLHEVAAAIRTLLGGDAANELLFRLGPKDLQTASALPILERVANLVRHELTATARAGDCDCSTSWGCDSNSQCGGDSGCTPDTTWPMCGLLWSDPCDGACGSGAKGS
jgi:hypothetical protein